MTRGFMCRFMCCVCVQTSSVCPRPCCLPLRYPARTGYEGRRGGDGGTVKSERQRAHEGDTERDRHTTRAPTGVRDRETESLRERWSEIQTHRQRASKRDHVRSKEGIPQVQVVCWCWRLRCATERESNCTVIVARGRTSTQRQRPKFPLSPCIQAPLKLGNLSSGLSQATERGSSFLLRHLS